MREESHNQSIQKITQQLVEHYHIPVARNKKDVLDTIFFQIKAQKKKKRNNIIQLSPILYVKVAAALVLALLALHFFTATVAFSGKSGITKTYRLPDHSRIVLLPNSNVSVGKYFWNRKLFLEGTAYFEVEKGQQIQGLNKTW